MEENDLYTRIAQLPRTASVRKVNDLIKRARLAKVHAFLLDHLYNNMPWMFGHAKEQERMVRELPSIYQEIAMQRGLPLGDFPDPKMMQMHLAPMDFTTFKPLDVEKLEALESLLSVDLPRLLQQIPEEQAAQGVVAAPVLQVGGLASPFAVMKIGGASEASVFQAGWLVPPDLQAYANEFEALGPNSAGKVSGQQARDKLVESKLPSNVLHRIWALSDVDQDGSLTLAEYALARHLVEMKLNGQDLPASLPPEMLPEELSQLRPAASSESG